MVNFDHGTTHMRIGVCRTATTFSRFTSVPREDLAVVECTVERVYNSGLKCIWGRVRPCPSRPGRTRVRARLAESDWP